MNQFYVVLDEDQEDPNEYAIKYFGDKIARNKAYNVGGYIRIDKVYIPAKEYDYDRKFIELIYSTKPIFKVIQLLDFHFENYKNPKDEFISQIKYVILPKLNPAYKNLINDWLNMKKPSTETTSNFSISMKNINAPVQIQQKSDNSIQTHNTTFNQEELNKLFTLIKADIQNLDSTLREDFEMEMNYAVKNLSKGNDIKPQLLNLSSLITNVGLPIFTNLTSSGIFEALKPFLGLK